MKIYRIIAMLRRHVLLTFRDTFRYIDLFYWPAFDIIVWGFTARWFEAGGGQHNTMTFVLLTSFVVWQTLVRVNMELSFSLLDELWSHNFTNLFASPLTIFEWISAGMILGLFKSLVSFLFGALVVWLVYSFNLFLLIPLLLPFFLVVLICGWSIGFLASSALMYGGQKVQMLLWIIGCFFVPFSNIFYPVAILPKWAQVVSSCIPTSYLFKALRITLTTSHIPWLILLQALSIALLYFLLTFILFTVSFAFSQKLGLPRLEQDQ